MTQTRNDEGLGQRRSSCDEKDAMDLGEIWEMNESIGNNQLDLGDKKETRQLYNSQRHTVQSKSS